MRKAATLFDVASGYFGVHGAQDQYYYYYGLLAAAVVVPLGGTLWRSDSMLGPGRLVHVRSQVEREQLGEKYGGMGGVVFDGGRERAVVGLRARRLELRLRSRERTHCWLQQKASLAYNINGVVPSDVSPMLLVVRLGAGSKQGPRVGWA